MELEYVLGGLLMAGRNMHTEIVWKQNRVLQVYACQMFTLYVEKLFFFIWVRLRYVIWIPKPDNTHTCLNLDHGQF